MKKSPPFDPNQLDGHNPPVSNTQGKGSAERMDFEELPPWFFDDVLYLTEMLAKPIEEARREAKDFNPAFFTIYI